MKKFLEEYGFAILTAIAVIVLICVCTPIGGFIKNQIMDVVNHFAQKTETRLITQDVEVIVSLKQLDDTGKFEVSVDSGSITDEFSVEYRIKDQNGNWSNYKPIGELSTGEKEHTGEFTGIIENNNKIQVRVKDSNKNENEYFESNILLYTGAASTTEEEAKNKKQLDPGLYDINDKLVVTYEKSGLNTQNNFTSKNYSTKTDSGYKVLLAYPTVTKIVLPDNIKKIGDYMFAHCSQLKEVIGPSVTSIGKYAFVNDSNMTNIVVSKSLLTISSYAFSGCSSITSFDYLDSATSIGEYSFNGCSSLKAISFSNNLTSLGQHSFDGCSSITSVEIPSTITTVNAYTFQNCSSLTSVKLPNTLINIYKSAFNGCSSLESIIIPISVTTVNAGTFSNCPKLTIYAERASAPYSWKSNWNGGQPVVWGYTG